MLTKQKKKKAVSDYALHEKDTGSAAVQAAILTERIKELAQHLKKNPKDHSSRRGLLKMVGKRRRFLNYLEKNNNKTFKELKKKLEI